MEKYIINVQFMSGELLASLRLQHLVLAAVMVHVMQACAAVARSLNFL